MLPLARFDDSTQGRWAALVLDKILSRQNVFANFRTDEAIELAGALDASETWFVHMGHEVSHEAVQVGGGAEAAAGMSDIVDAPEVSHECPGAQGGADTYM